MHVPVRLAIDSLSVGDMLIRNCDDTRVGLLEDGALGDDSVIRDIVLMKRVCVRASTSISAGDILSSASGQCVDARYSLISGTTFGTPRRILAH